MRYRTILFDFDGTLADTAELAVEVINRLTPEFGWRPIEEHEIPMLKQMSAWQLLTERAGIPLWNFPKIHRLERRVREEFAARAARVELSPGMPEMLKALYDGGYEIGIVTSNSRDIVAGALSRAGVRIHFMHTGSRFFGKSYAIKQTLAEYSLERTRTLYIGDELRDVEACKKAGVDMLGVAWGFNSVQALQAAGVKVVSSPDDLLRAIAEG